MPDDHRASAKDAAQSVSADTGPVELMTTGKIARELGVPVQRVLHVLRTRPYIEPRAKAGIVRLFDREGVALITREVQKIDARNWGMNQKGGQDDPTLF